MPKSKLDRPIHSWKGAPSALPIGKNPVSNGE